MSNDVLYLLQKELENFVNIWNCHHMRHCKNQNVPHGRPLVLYSIPWLFQSEDYLQPVQPEVFDACIEETLQPDNICDSDIKELCEIYMQENALDLANDVFERFDLYIKLKEVFEHDLTEVI